MADRILASSAPRRRSAWLPALAVLLAGLGAVAGWWWQSQSRPVGAHDGVSAELAAAGIDADEKAAFETLVRNYILEHPEVLPEAMERLQSKGTAQAIAAQRDRIETPFAGATLGNPRGTVTLVQFTDYACTYCRQSVADLDAIVAAHPDVRVVIRELPILSPQSERAARMALAAARQGRYARFHQAMFAAGPPSPAAITGALDNAGVAAADAATFGDSADVTRELAANQALARQLGISGTPAWIVGDRMLVGAVGREALEQAIAEARRPA